jgi:hypothetical protein
LSRAPKRKIGGGVKADRGWQRPGRQFVTLQDAATYIMKLAKPEQKLAEWQAAIEALLVAEHNGPTMLARIGVMRALNRHVEHVFNFNPDWKDPHWGRRKLARNR